MKEKIFVPSSSGSGGRLDSESINMTAGQAFTAYPFNYNCVCYRYVGGIEFNLLFTFMNAFDVRFPMQQVALVRHAVVVLLGFVLRTIKLTSQLEAIVVE